MTENTAPLRAYRQSLPEFIALIALLFSMVALSIDTVLPALSVIGEDLAVARANDTQLVVSLFFLGFGAGQMFYGPVSDSVGRKPMLLAGFLVFVLGCVLSMTAWNYETELAGRVLQGLGAASLRTVTLAVVRDRYSGRRMARIMSFMLSVFIIVPALAPSLGQAVLHVADWRAIFLFQIALAVLAVSWMSLRLEETLPRGRRLPFSLGRIGLALQETLTTRATVGYMLAAGTIFGAFNGYLNSVRQVFQDVLGVGEKFPLFFAVLALSLGAASFVNSKLVLRFGIRVLAFAAVGALTGFSALFAVILLILAPPPLWAFMLWGMASFFCLGLLFGNLNALAMEPLGHIAGTGAAVVGTFVTFTAMILGIAIGQSFDGTALPLVAGFAMLGALSGLIMRITNRGWHGAG